ncbi:hypothetical protein Ancab_000500 [Ancistrocladus abbreviatus]
MNCKCGPFQHAAELFRTIRDRDVVSWNVMIMGVKRFRQDEASFSTFLNASASLAFIESGHFDLSVLKDIKDWNVEGITPDYVTVVCFCLLWAYWAGGSRISYFNSMKTHHSMDPGPEHHACKVDMLGHAGQPGEAKRF